MNKILIIFPSWEERSALGFTRFVEENIDIDKVYLLKFEQPMHEQEIESHVSIMNDLCKNKNINCEHISIPKSEVDKWHTLDNFVKNIDSNVNVHLDITTMPRSIIWMLMFFLKQKHKEMTAIYHKSEIYSEEWLSKDPDVPHLLFKHSGIIEFGKPTTIFVLAGYDEDRVIQLINFYEPYKTIVGECNQRDVYRYGSTNVEKFNIDEHDNLWGYNSIENKIEDILKTSNLIVASLGPKTGAISVYQCFMKHPKIALSYVPCKEFNKNYSKGLGETLIKKVPLF
jgi:hypothetical protein